MEIKQGSSFRVPVILTDLYGNAVTGVTYSQVTAYLQKQAGSAAQKILTTAGQFIEIDAVNMPGVYDLLLASGDTDTVGFLKYTITYGQNPIYRGLMEIVANVEADAVSLLIDLKDEAFGKWVLDAASDTLTLYRTDGTTALKTFNLTRASPAPPAYVQRTPA